MGGIGSGAAFYSGNWKPRKVERTPQEKREFRDLLLNIIHTKEITGLPTRTVIEQVFIAMANKTSENRRQNEYHRLRILKNGGTYGLERNISTC